MQRGFKSRCEETSKRLRRAIGVPLDVALPFMRLAEHLGVLVWSPDDVPGLDARCVQQLTVVDPTSWSAVTIRDGDRHLIIRNPSHSDRRTPNNVVHELAHIILGHAPTRVDVSPSGLLWLQSYGRELEEEADWLAGALLVPRDGLIQVYRTHRSIDAVAEAYSVSIEPARWRLNSTGIARQLERARRRAQPAN